MRIRNEWDSIHSVDGGGSVCVLPSGIHHIASHWNCTHTRAPKRMYNLWFSAAIVAERWGEKRLTACAQASFSFSERQCGSGGDNSSNNSNSNNDSIWRFVSLCWQPVCVNGSELAELVSCSITNDALALFYFRLRLIINSTRFLRGHVFILHTLSISLVLRARLCASVRSQCTHSHHTHTHNSREKRDTNCTWYDILISHGIDQVNWV